MIFAEDLHDTVYIVNSEGYRHGPYKTSLSPTSAFIFKDDIDINEGDTLTRFVGNKEERYVIRLAHFTQTPDRDIPSHWNLTLEKESAIPSKTAAQAGSTYHISHSTGFQAGNNNNLTIQNAIAELIQRIDDANDTEESKTDAKGRLNAFLSHPLVTTIVGGAVNTYLASHKF